MGTEKERPKESSGPSRREVVAGLTWSGVGATALRWSIPTSLLNIAINGGKLYEQRDRVVRELLDTQHENDEYVQTAQRFLEHMYRVRIEFGVHSENENLGPGERLTGTGLPVAEARRALLVISNALKAYPVDFFERNRIPRIRVAKNLTTYVRVGAFSAQRIRLGGLAHTFGDDWDDTLYVSYLPEREGLMESNFHHELFHVLDYRDNAYEDDDREWAELHEACGCGSYDMNGRGIFALAGGPFVNGYASTNPVEDRATTAETMLIPETHAYFLEIIENTKEPEIRELLQRKYDSIKDTFLRLSGGSMNEQYWDEVIREGRQSRRPVSYWAPGTMSEGEGVRAEPFE